MNLLDDKVAVHPLRTACRWRYAAIGILSFVLLGLTCALDAKKPVTPPPPPPPDGDVLYVTLGGEEDYDPLTVCQTDTEGAVWVDLFSIDVEKNNYYYNQVLPSEHCYGLNQSRLFACSKTLADLNPPDGDYWSYEVGLFVPTSLTIVDESNNTLINVLEGYNIAIEPRNKIVWYADDTKLVFEGCGYSVVDEDSVPKTIQLNWETVGFYLVDLSFADGTITASEPTLIQGSRENLFVEPSDDYPFPWLNNLTFVIEERELGSDRIYYHRVVDPSNGPWNSLMNLYRANIEGTDFSEVNLSDVFFVNLQISSDNAIVSGIIEGNVPILGTVDTIVYYHTANGTVEFIEPADKVNIIEWTSPLWSPDSQEVIYREYLRLPSLRIKTMTLRRADKYLQDPKVIYSIPKGVEANFIGWREVP